MFTPGMPSDPTIFWTDDKLPPAVNNLHLVRASVAAVRLAWQAPHLSAYNSLKGYQVYLNYVEYALVTECGVTISNLTAGTTYQVHVCAVTARGKGPTASLNVTTASVGEYSMLKFSFWYLYLKAIRFRPELRGTAKKSSLFYFFPSDPFRPIPRTLHPLPSCPGPDEIHPAPRGALIPAPPAFFDVSRRELPVKWQPPEVLAGRFNRYELLCNGRSIYSGTDQEYHATMLKPDTEYALEVIVFTNEGRFRSRPAKTRTLKDDYHFTQRHSLYESSTQNPIRAKYVEEVQLFLSPPPLTNGSPPKVSPPTERRASKESVAQPRRNVQITTLRALQFKSEGPPQDRALPSLIKAAQLHSATNNTRTYHRSKTVLTPGDQPWRTSAAIVVPTLDIDHESQVIWHTAAVRPITKSKTFRFPAPAPALVTSAASSDTSLYREFL